MGFFDAFLRGAAGSGLIEVAKMNERRDELDRQREDRERSKEEERRFREEQARLDRELRGRGRRSGSGSGDDDDVAASDDRAALLGIMDKYGASEAQARGLLARSRSGENPFTRETSTPEQIEDGDRKRTVTVKGTAPDVERWMELNRTVAQSIMTGTGGNAEQRADARVKQTGLNAARDYAGGDRQAGVLLLGTQGKTQYTNEGTDLTSGVPVAGSRDAAQIDADKALANDRNASAAKDRATAARDAAEAKDSDLNSAKRPYLDQIRDLDKDPLLSLDPKKKAAAADAIRTRMDADPEIVRLRERVRKAPGDKPTGAPKAPPADVLKQARDAIAKGADKARIKARLKELGYTDAGL